MSCNQHATPQQAAASRFAIPRAPEEVGTATTRSPSSGKSWRKSRGSAQIKSFSSAKSWPLGGGDGAEGEGPVGWHSAPVVVKDGWRIFVVRLREMMGIKVRLVVYH